MLSVLLVAKAKANPLAPLSAKALLPAKPAGLNALPEPME